MVLYIIVFEKVKDSIYYYLLYGFIYVEYLCFSFFIKVMLN